MAKIILKILYLRVVYYIILLIQIIIICSWCITPLLFVLLVGPENIKDYLSIFYSKIIAGSFLDFGIIPQIINNIIFNFIILFLGGGPFLIGYSYDEFIEERFLNIVYKKIDPRLEEYEEIIKIYLKYKIGIVKTKLMSKRKEVKIDRQIKKLYRENSKKKKEIFRKLMR